MFLSQCSILLELLPLYLRIHILPHISFIHSTIIYGDPVKDALGIYWRIRPTCCQETDILIEEGEQTKKVNICMKFSFKSFFFFFFHLKVSRNWLFITLILCFPSLTCLKSLVSLYPFKLYLLNFHACVVALVQANSTIPMASFLFPDSSQSLPSLSNIHPASYPDPGLHYPCSPQKSFHGPHWLQDQVYYL